MRKKTVKSISSDIGTVINNNAYITGDISFSGYLHINGTLEGSAIPNQQVDDDAIVYVDENSYVKGNITANHITIAGKVDGNLSATNSIKLEPTALVVGDISYSNIEMELGAKVQGNFLHQLEQQEIQVLEDKKESLPN
jgi:cytoskeletal protein CcmA (bactofilin family)